MRSRINTSLAAISFCLFAAAANSPVSFSIDGDDPGAWPQILSSVGFTQGHGLPSGIFVVRAGSALSPELLNRVRAGGFAILEGESDTATKLGFIATKQNVVVRSIVDRRAPKLSIVWEKS